MASTELVSRIAPPGSVMESIEEDLSEYPDQESFAPTTEGEMANGQMATNDYSAVRFQEALAPGPVRWHSSTVGRCIFLHIINNLLRSSACSAEPRFDR